MKALNNVWISTSKPLSKPQYLILQKFQDSGYPIEKESKEGFVRSDDDNNDVQFV